MGGILARGGITGLMSLGIEAAQETIMVDAVARGCCPDLQELTVSLDAETLESTKRITPRIVEALGTAMASSYLQHLTELEVVGLQIEGFDPRPPFAVIAQPLLNGACPALTKFNTCGCIITSNDWHDLGRLMESGRFSQLEHLVLYNYHGEQDTGVSITGVMSALEATSWPKLTHLELSGFPTDTMLADSVANLLVALPLLHSLDIKWYEPDAGIRLLERIHDACLPSLHLLSMSWSENDERHSRLLGEILAVGTIIPQLESLSLNDCHAIGDEGIAIHVMHGLGLGQCRHIKELEFKGFGIDSECVGVLSTAITLGFLPNLRVLSLDSNELIGDEAIVELVSRLRASCGGLEVLSLAYTGMEENAYQALFSALQDNVWPRLERLNLSIQHRDQVQALATIFATTGTVTRLESLNLFCDDHSPSCAEIYRPLIHPFSQGACPGLKCLGIKTPSHDIKAELQASLRGRAKVGGGW